MFFLKCNWDSNDESTVLMTSILTKESVIKNTFIFVVVNFFSPELFKSFEMDHFHYFALLVECVVDLVNWALISDNFWVHFSAVSSCFIYFLWSTSDKSWSHPQFQLLYFLFCARISVFILFVHSSLFFTECKCQSWMVCCIPQASWLYAVCFSGWLWQWDGLHQHICIWSVWWDCSPGHCPLPIHLQQPRVWSPASKPIESEGELDAIRLAWPGDRSLRARI